MKKTAIVILVLAVIGFFLWLPIVEMEELFAIRTELRVQKGVSLTSEEIAKNFYFDFSEMIFKWYKIEGRRLLESGWKIQIFLGFSEDGKTEEIFVFVGRQDSGIPLAEIGSVSVFDQTEEKWISIADKTVKDTIVALLKLENTDKSNPNKPGRGNKPVKEEVVI